MARGPRPVVLFDLDGTLALRTVRGPYDWLEAASDTPNGPVVTILQSLAATGHGIIYVSGRPEEARALTEEWIEREIGVLAPLFMRPSGDSRKDTVVKREIYEVHIRPLYDVVAVFDDRTQVVRMWREQLGLPCFQVADGDF